MDNLTHTLIGVLVGDAADRAVAPGKPGLPARTRRTLGLGLMAIGSNLPDADFLYPALTGSKLDYLLHHRGHTHTILGALLLTGLLLALLALWLRYRRIAWSQTDARYLAALALLGPLLHLGLDFTNSYGVHPFWPVRNDWFYGDAVFIVEPLLWAAATPLVFTLHTLLARTLVALVLLAGVALSFLTGLVPPSLTMLLSLLVGGLALIAWRARVPVALAAGLVTWLGITLMFFVTGALAESRLQRLLASNFPAARTLDIVLTPMPVNPLCREVFAVQLDNAHYVIRKATHALLPDWLTASECPQRTLGSASTAPLAGVPAASSADILWVGELTMPRTLIGTLAERYCAMRAMLRFARVPWAIPRGDGWLVGDLRYDREPEAGFAEIEVGPGKDECLALVPPWLPPRADVLPSDLAGPGSQGW